MHEEKILVIDYGSQYTQLIARRIRENNTYCEVLSSESLIKIKNLDNILKLIGEIDAAPTDGMLPMAHPLDFSQPLRDDICKKDINREENQHDSTKIKDGYYTVPKILD